jgi:hypothetical protein
MRHALSLTIVSVFATTLVAVGCGTSSGTATDALAACKAGNEASQAAFTRCFGGNVGISVAPLDPISAEYSARACVNNLGAPGVAVTGAIFNACAEALKTATCESFADVIGGTRTAIPACDFPKGKLATGAACGDDVQCAGYCDLPTDKNCGVCTALPGENLPCGNSRQCAAGLVCGSRTTCEKVPPESSEGGACDDAGKSCKFGLSCGPDKKCIKIPTLGQACTDFCSSSRCDISGTKKCVPYLKAGEACLFTGCEAGLNCTNTQGAQKCTAAVKAKAGEACGSGIECVDSSCGEDRKCKALANENEACDAVSTRCRRGLDCLDKKCLVRNPALCK